MSTNDVVFTQRLIMHLNAGSKFSELHYDILADGKPTGIKRLKRTDGSPRCLITNDIFVCGKEHFDNLAARGVGCMDWVRAHAVRAHDGTEEVTADA